MNASAQGGTVWSIRNLLVTAVALLALFGIGISGHVLRNASLERVTAADAASRGFMELEARAGVGAFAAVRISALSTLYR